MEKEAKSISVWEHQYADNGVGVITSFAARPKVAQNYTSQHSAVVAAHRVVAEWAGPLPETKILFISLNVVEHWRIHVLRKRGKAQKVMRSGFWQWQPPLDRHVTKSGLMLLPWALSVCWPALLSPRAATYTHTHTLLSLMFACRQFAEQLSICGRTWQRVLVKAAYFCL